MIGKSMAETRIPFYYIETANSNAAIAVYVNDVLVHTDRLARNSEKRTSINQWVHGGTNNLKVNITVPPMLDEVPDDFEVRLGVVEYIRSGEDLQRKECAQLSWEYTGAGTMPVIETAPFECGMPVDSWFWYDADAFNEETLPYEEVRGVIGEFYSVLDRKDMDALEKLLEVKAREMADAFGIPLDERLHDQRNFFESLFSKAGWGMQPPSLDDFFVYYHAGGRLVEIIDRKASPILHSKPLDGDSKFMLSMYLARKNGRWVLCR